MLIKDLLKQKSTVYLIGIKGTGVCALAELLHYAKCDVSGSDIPEEFYTDAILKKLKIPFYTDIDPSRINKDIDLVIHSAAYSAETNLELARAKELKIPVLKYTDALGEISKMYDSIGVCGVHGKTTTTAMCGVLMRAADLPAQVLAGSAVIDFNGMSTISLGDKYFIAETCEYREHFLSFQPRRIILTSVESDHQDYFPTYISIRDAFVKYCRLLPEGGQLFYCADDQGATDVAHIIEKDERNIELIPYGFTAKGDWQITSYRIDTGKENSACAYFTLAGISHEFELTIPGKHEALNAAVSLALTKELLKNENKQIDDALLNIKNAIKNFKSTKRRSEIIGIENDIIFMDDYGHHPTAIKTTLEGIKSFYPKRRLIVSFMSHTFTRTSYLLDDFAKAFNDADMVFFHKIYASAREDYKGGVNGVTLFEKTQAIRKSSGSGETFYYEEYNDAFVSLCEILKSGDIFLTLGAGNNWPLGVKLLKHFEVKHD